MMILHDLYHLPDVFFLFFPFIVAEMNAKLLQVCLLCAYAFQNPN